MEVVLRTGFQGVTHSIQFHPQAKLKGKALAVSHVMRVEELSGISESDSKLIRCSVVRQTSVNLHPYKVTLEIDEKRHVTEVPCTCVSEAAKKCKHIYALIYYINADRSATKTTIEQEWGKPTDTQLGEQIYSKPLVVTDVFKVKEKSRDGSQILENIQPYNLQYSDLLNIPCPLRAIIKEERSSEAQMNVTAIIIDLLNLTVKLSRDLHCEAIAWNLINFSDESEIFTPCQNIEDIQVLKFYEEEVKLCDAEIVHLCVSTQAQSDCAAWFHARKLRISASLKSHSIKTRTKKDCHALVDEFLRATDVKKNIPSLEYRRRHEKDAFLF